MTTFTYDSSHRVTKVEQRNTTAGSPVPAVTRFSYASDTSTLVADPRSDQSKAVADTAHTTYTLNRQRPRRESGRPEATSVRDVQVHEQRFENSTVGAGSTASTSTNSYDANDGQSLTQTHPRPAAPTPPHTGRPRRRRTCRRRRPTAPRTTTTFGYDGPGNQVLHRNRRRRARGVDRDARVQHEGHRRERLGAVKTAQAPATRSRPPTATTATTSSRRSPHRPTQWARSRTGTTLFGRVNKLTDGGGGVTTYTNDNRRPAPHDRILGRHPDGDEHYDGNGNLLTEQSATGTITNAYDQRNRSPPRSTPPAAAP